MGEGTVEQVDAAIIGAGFGGIAAAIRLTEENVGDIVLLERDDDVGGTWRDNTYPGAQCDVPSNLYSFSFAPNPTWTRSYPEQPQILEYLRDVAAHYGVTERTRFGWEVLDARWDAGTSRWEIETSGGRLSARLLVAAAGILSDGVVPEIEGADRFEGVAFHSSRWDHSRDLAGRRVALVGTGATSTQIAPRIQPEVENLTVFQRTPPWVMPHLDRPIGRWLRWLYRRVPVAQRAARWGVYVLREGLVPPMRHPLIGRVMALYARMHLRRQVRDPALRRRLLPDYAIGCKRMLLSNDWYPTLQQENVTVVDVGVASLDENGVVDADGTHHEVDTIVWATGFRPANPKIAHRLHDAGGRSLADTWEGSPHALIGTTIPGFPNLFLLYGPNTNLAHTSIVFMLEAQVEYMVEAIRTMRDADATTIVPRPEAEQRYTEEVQGDLEGTVWNEGGCASWYLDANGNNSVMWPRTTTRFWHRTRTLDPERYELGGRAAVNGSDRADAAAPVG